MPRAFAGPFPAPAPRAQLSMSPALPTRARPAGYSALALAFGMMIRAT